VLAVQGGRENLVMEKMQGVKSPYNWMEQGVADCAEKMGKSKPLGSDDDNT